MRSDPDGTATVGASPSDVAPGRLGSEFGLTSREAQVMERITLGLSNKEVATDLFLGVNTVKTYIRSAYRKVEVLTRPEAVLWGVRHGLHPELGPRAAPPDRSA